MECDGLPPLFNMAGSSERRSDCDNLYVAPGVMKSEGEPSHSKSRYSNP